jgi:molybdopterin-guanine dinucleotide biosynthesis protein B
MGVPAIISIVGPSGSGKTTLLEKLIPELVRRGLKIGTIKHDVHGFDMDRPGKDSWRHKQAGAQVSVISSPNKVGMVMDVDHDNRPIELSPLFTHVDIVLTEGYKTATNDKIEVFRPEIHEELLCRDDETLVAVASDVPVDIKVPRFPLQHAEELADFLIAHFKLSPVPAKQFSKATPRAVSDRKSDP